MKVLKGLLSLLLCLCLIMPMGSALVAISDGGGADVGKLSVASAADPGEAAPSEVDYSELYAALMAAETFAEAQALLAGLSDEQLEAFIESLTEEQYIALEAHINELIAAEPHAVPETVVFTDAGPFMPSVNVEEALQLLAGTGSGTRSDTDNNGLDLSKTVVANSDGSYTITLEAYTTGSVTTSTQTIPVDIVLVLDQSGSMAYDFDGNNTNTNTNRRQYAMKQAVNSFIEQVNAKYDADADHRMAIVTFGSEASILQGWTNVDEQGKGTLQSRINGLPDSPSGATNVGAGMQQAETLMGSGYNYTGQNTTRQKVVIVFTDGVPTTSTAFDTTVANTAISSAKNLKDSGVTVYSVGIFNGADPNQLYGEKADYGFYEDVPCTGEVGSVWGGNFLSDLFGGDVRNDDIPAGNRFLNFISNNFPSADGIGIEYGRYNPGGYWGGSIVGYKITANFDRNASNYYLTANNADTLNTIFQTISDQISVPTISLGSETVVRDVVTQYFNVPAEGDIHLYTMDYDGTDFDGIRDSAAGVTAAVSGDTISVTGFDYNANFITSTAHEDGTYGKKLIIEFTVTPKAGFLGGNDVPTNGDSSGVYPDSDTSTAIENFPVPTVNVQINPVSVTSEDKNVYLFGGLTAAQLKNGATATCGSVILDLSDSNEVVNYGLEEWQNEYVNVTVTIKDADGNVISGFTNLDEDTTYILSVTVSPKSDGIESFASGGGDLASEQQADSELATINVFKPVLTFRDSDVWYGDTFAEDYDNYNKVSEVWMHGEAIDSAVNMIGDKPELTLTYDTPPNAIVSGYVAVPDDIKVNVTVKLGENDITGFVTFNHQHCFEGEILPAGYEFLLHVQTCSLTISKSITGGGEPHDTDQSFIFTVRYPGLSVGGSEIIPEYTYEVVIKGAGSRTIVGLPVGVYTVAENSDWSWRYELDEDVAQPGDVELTASESGSHGEVTFTNKLITDSNWLGDEYSAVNVFNSNGSENQPTVEMNAILPGKEEIVDGE